MSLNDMHGSSFILVVLMCSKLVMYTRWHVCSGTVGQSARKVGMVLETMFIWDLKVPRGLDHRMRDVIPAPPKFSKIP